MGLNVKLVFKPFLNVVYCSTDAIVVNVVQHCSGQIWPKLGVLAKISPAPPTGGAKTVSKETVHFGYCLHRQTFIVESGSVKSNMGLGWPNLVEYDQT